MGDRCVCGICGSEAQAAGLIEELKLAGFSNDDISALLPDKTGSRDFGYRRASKAPEAAMSFGLLGGLGGAALGWALSTGEFAYPELRPVVAAGPMFAALSGAAVLGYAGGILGALAGMVFPEFEVTRFRGKMRHGNILLSVHCDDAREARVAKRLFRRGGARHVAGLPERSPKRNSNAAPISHHGTQ
jgi:hypothetical protein